MLSPFKPKIRGLCQVSSYLLDSVLFKLKEMGTLVELSVPTTDVSTKRKLNQRVHPIHHISNSLWQNILDLAVCKSIQGKVLGRRA